MKAIAKAGMLATAVLALAPAGSASASATNGGLDSFVPGEALVRFKPSLPGAEVRSLLGADGASVAQSLPAVPGVAPRRSAGGYLGVRGHQPVREPA